MKQTPNTKIYTLKRGRGPTARGGDEGPKPRCRWACGGRQAEERRSRPGVRHPWGGGTPGPSRRRGWGAPCRRPSRGRRRRRPWISVRGVLSLRRASDFPRLDNRLNDSLPLVGRVLLAQLNVDQPRQCRIWVEWDGRSPPDMVNSSISIAINDVGSDEIFGLVINRIFLSFVYVPPDYLIRLNWIQIFLTRFSKIIFLEFEFWIKFKFNLVHPQTYWNRLFSKTDLVPNY